MARLRYAIHPGRPTADSLPVMGMSASTRARRVYDRLLISRRVRSLREMYESLHEVTNGTDLPTALTTLASTAANALGASDGAVMIRKDDDLRTYSKLRVEPMANAMGRRAFVAGAELPSVRVMRTGEAVVVPDLDAYQGPPGFDEACRAADVRATLCVPIKLWGETTGSLNLGYARPKVFRKKDISLAIEYANQAATALARARVMEIEHDAKKAVTDLDELKADFLTNVSHELQTPLTTISGYSELLAQDELPDEMRKTITKRLVDQTKVLAGLVDHLLDARGVAAKATDLEELQLRMLAIRASDAINEFASDRTVSIEIDPAINVWAQASWCERVLNSLLTNAVQYSPESSTITISARTDADAVITSISDQGVGIPDDERERIFERFYRVHRTDSAVRGTGLGLSIARNYVEAMGGHMWVTSVVGEGSTFSFTLPLRPPKESVA